MESSSLTARKVSQSCLRAGVAPTRVTHTEPPASQLFIKLCHAPETNVSLSSSACFPSGSAAVWVSPAPSVAVAAGAWLCGALGSHRGGTAPRCARDWIFGKIPSLKGWSSTVTLPGAVLESPPVKVFKKRVAVALGSWELFNVLSFLAGQDCVDDHRII